MEIHRFSSPSLVDEVAIVETESGSRRAYLHASDTAESAKLANIKEKLTLNGWQVIPAHFAGKPMLEVRAFGSNKQLIDSLAEFECTQGKPETIKNTPETKKSFKEKIKDHSLQASGVAYVGGDLCFMKYGFAGARPLDVLAGLFYMGGSAALMGFGQSDKSDLQIKDMSRDMLAHSKKAGKSLPESCTLNTITQEQNQGLVDKAIEFGRRYPAELMNSSFGVAGALITASAYKNHFLMPPHAGASPLKHKLVGAFDIGLGTMTLASGLTSILVKEKKPDPDEPATGWWQRLKNWVQEKPLRVAGYGYMVSTLLHAGSTAVDMYDAKKSGDAVRLKSVPFRAGFVGLNLVAEYLMAQSSKGHGEGVTSDDSVKDSMVSIAAELVLKQPKEQQEQQFQHMVNYLEHPKVLAEKRSVVEEKLREQIKVLENNPWLCGKETAMPSKPEIIGTLPADAPVKDWRKFVSTPKSTAQLAVAG